MTPMYIDEFLGDKSRLMSIRGVPLTFNSFNNKSVNSLVGDSFSPSSIEESDSDGTSNYVDEEDLW